jgi:hypothetical protein
MMSPCKKTTKKEKLEYFKTLINDTGLCSSLKIQHPCVYEKLMDLFLTHPDYPEKIDDVVDIAIIKNKINTKYFELQLIKSNSATDNISYLACINKPNTTKHLKEAMRYAILPQILNFKKTQLKPECSICKSDNDIQIDHLILFKHLYDEFIKNRDDIPSKFNENYFNGAQFKPNDYLFEKEWFEFHQEKAMLRCLCKNCNLTRKKT